MDGVQFSTKNNCAVIVRFWHDSDLPQCPISEAEKQKSIDLYAAGGLTKEAYVSTNLTLYRVPLIRTGAPIGAIRWT